MNKIENVCTGYHMDIQFEGVPNKDIRPLILSFKPFGNYDEIISSNRNGTNPNFKFDIKLTDIEYESRSWINVTMRIGYRTKNDIDWFGMTNFDIKNIKTGEYKLQLYEERANPFIFIIIKRKEIEGCTCTIKINKIIVQRYTK